MLIILLLLLLLFAFLGFIYYRRQQKADNIGGPISQAKAFWLAYVLFNYFGLSAYLLFYLPPEMPGYFTLLVFTVLITLRAIIQMVMMYGFLNWRPPYGIISNLLIAAVLLILLSIGIPEGSLENARDYILPLFITQLIALLLCDSYYARAFHRIIGGETTGKKALWFASGDDVRFGFINRLTYRFNIFFVLFTAGILALIIIVYG